MITIGELSTASKVTVKTIRYYQEMGILEPIKRDSSTGYRYYDVTSYERLQGIIILKDFGFSIKEIQNILSECSVEEDLQFFISEKITKIKKEIKNLKLIEERLTMFNKQINTSSEYEEVDIKEFTFTLNHYVGVKVEGAYHNIGVGFNKLYKKLGRFITGAPLAFYYDMEYKEKDANMEAVVELKKKSNITGFESREIIDKKAIKITHKGSYGTQGNSYVKLFEYCKNNGLKPEPPIIERYIKGPGMIFKGNPENYITECIFVINK